MISAVNASASGTTLTVTWTTDEAATSAVDYGTSAASLSSHATSAGLTTSHTVAITGIAPNTRYYYRVTSADGSGNAPRRRRRRERPGELGTPVTPVVGRPDGRLRRGHDRHGNVRSSNGGGEVVLPRARSAQEFTGTHAAERLDGDERDRRVGQGVGWSGDADQQPLTSSATYNAPRSLEIFATLRPNHTIGWVTSSNSSLKYSFSVNTSNQLVATVNDGRTTSTSSVIATGWVAAAHKFRIEWASAGTVTMYLDDVQKYTHSVSNFYTNLRPSLSDSVANDAGLKVTVIRVGPYAATGTFTSRVLDAKASVSWDGLSWDATVPSGTTLTVQVRTGNTATPDGTWSAYHTVSASGGAIGTTSQYVQYAVTMTSSGSQFVTPTVRSMTAAFHI